MSVDYEAVVMVGLQRKDFEDEDKLEEMLDDDILQPCPPYYDGVGDDKEVIGFVYEATETYSSSKLEWDPTKIEKLKNKFKKLTGLDASVWLSTRGW
jgi:hypothetical protein